MRPSNLTFNDVGYSFYDTDIEKDLFYKKYKAEEVINQSVNNNTIYLLRTEYGITSLYYYLSVVNSYGYFTGVYFAKDNNDSAETIEVFYGKTAFEGIIEAPNIMEYPYIKLNTTRPVNTSIKFYNVGYKWVEFDNATAGVLRSGTFSQKPAAADIYVGFKYFCTDKQTTEGAIDGIEIIHKGNDVWVDALGRVVS